YTLAHLLLKGQGGVRRDVGSAIGWFERSAGTGHKDAPFDLALLYLNGSLIPKDNRKALYWLHQAADAGNSEAHYYLAQIYKASDVEQAVIWLKQAAEAGHQMASKDLKAWCEDMPIACEGSSSSDN
ncbi:MAG: sel1 repeat family protein, partial [Desulfobacterales bacterium]|nr:sel1 repeat family protein [Desulfobacterales bacterium]